MVVATYKLQVDWNNDGDWGDTGEEIDMGRVRGITCSFGRDRASQLTGKCKAGTFRAVLDNRSGDYNPFNSSSPIYGNILPGRPVRLLGTSATQSDQAIWQGFLARITPQVFLGGDATAILEATGPLGQVNLDQIEVPMVASQRTDQVVDDILDAAGWGAGSSYRTLDTGKTTITRYWKSATYTVPALQEVESTEGGFIREGKDGKIIFDNRHHRLSGVGLTSQATYSDASGAARVYNNLIQDDPLPHIFNIFESDVQTYTTASVAVLWTLSETGASSPSISPGVARTWIARYPTSASANSARGVNAWTTTAATTDMTANSAADGSGTNVTSDIGVAVSKSSETMEITLTNNGSVTAYITKLQARGTAISADDPASIKQEDATSQTAFGKRTWPSRTKFIPDTGEALDWADFNLSIYKDPTAVLRMTYVANRDTNAINEMLDRDISERVTVVAENTADLSINRDFFIEAVQHQIGADRLHKVTYLLSDAVQFSDFWVLNTSALGTSTRLAY
ncbi:MAG: hypothetical protein QF467_06005 [SAR202 cluster bacterium]|jgi:hypothetical protein|nr:hypothetical protein [SAR202 cluster bacterium]